VKASKQKGLYKGRKSSISREYIMGDITSGLSVC
jgi:hypothetical protein